MISLLTSLVLLGLAAVDPVGIAVMPLLLTQPDGIRRSVWFLIGSALGITGLGVAFAIGAGHVMLRVTTDYPWLEPSVEIVCGVLLAGFGLYLWRRGGGTQVSDGMSRRLRMPTARLFGFGVGLVIIQSILDVVFIVAMVNIGARQLPALAIVLAVLVYAAAALLIQIVIVVAYASTAPGARRRLADLVTAWLDRYGTRAAVIGSITVGALLAGSGLSALAGGPHLG